MTRDYAKALLAAVIVTAGSNGLVAQQREHAIPTTVQAASFDRTNSGPRPEIQFGRRLPQVGDEVEQRLTLEMRLTTMLRQNNQLVEKNQTTMRNTQRRVVATTEVNGGRTTAVTVRYLEATKETNALPEAADGTQAPPPSPIAQAVAGKTYHCRREGGEDGKLTITDADGYIPPVSEYEIVAQNMEMVGRTNPLAEFLAGRSVAVGDTLELPQAVAARLFHLSERYGEVTRFDLTLQKTETASGATRAVFLARVEAASSDSSQMRMQVEGPLLVDIATCRTVSMRVSGPIGISETRGSYSTAHQLLGTGRLNMSIACQYVDARR